MRLVAAALVVGLLVLIPDAASAQCAMCRSVLGSADGQLLAAAFRASTLLLLAAPLVSVGTIMLLAARQQHRRAAEAATEHGRFVNAASPLQGSAGN